MLHLSWSNPFSVLTLLLIVSLALFIALSWKRRNRITKWGRLIALFIITGMAVSAFCAMRDGYATSSALFAMNSAQSIVCSIAGGVIILSGMLCLFLKKQEHRRFAFFTISMLFAIQVLTIEASRLSILL